MVNEIIYFQEINQVSVWLVLVIGLGIFCNAEANPQVGRHVIPDRTPQVQPRPRNHQLQGINTLNGNQGPPTGSYVMPDRTPQVQPWNPVAPLQGITTLNGDQRPHTGSYVIPDRTPQVQPWIPSDPLTPINTLNGHHYPAPTPPPYISYPYPIPGSDPRTWSPCPHYPSNPDTGPERCPIGGVLPPPVPHQCPPGSGPNGTITDDVLIFIIREYCKVSEQAIRTFLSVRKNKR